MGEFDLVKYYEGFEEALRRRYQGQDFRAGREVIKDLYKDVASGGRLLTINDVLATARPNAWTVRGCGSRLVSATIRQRLGRCVSSGSRGINLPFRIMH